jgi:UDP-N-acetyl-D-galactosamine dehydrogenase
MNKKISIIGLGYVGLPLAVEFSKIFQVIGYDIDKSRVKELKKFIDRTNEVSSLDLKSQSKKIIYTDQIESIQNSDFIIVTVPTPINQYKQPNLNPLINATKDLSKFVRKNTIIIYESTVFPGCTEEVCVPIIEDITGLTYNEDFFCGYSPERINPGDKINTLTKIKKITSGSNEETSEHVDNLYNKIIKAGTYKAPSIKVAEAAKAIENAQRDLNISFVNELAIIFDRMNIDTDDVLKAAGTKWNFLNFKPGLVGGHCISVDPYYLTSKSESLGYYPEVILSGRRVNDNMPKFISSKSIKLLIKNGIDLNNCKALILGITFKENCPDTRNTKVIDIYKELSEYGITVDVFDPYASQEQVFNDYKIKLVNKLKKYELIILAVAHSDFKKLKINKLKSSERSVVFDLKCMLNREFVNSRL